MPSIDIKVRNIRKSFRDTNRNLLVLNDISFDVEKGEFLCILGPSGCGKTTLLKLLSGILAPDSGEIEINEERRMLGKAYLSQSANILPWRTVLENVVLGLELQGKLNQNSVNSLKLDLEEWGLGGFENTRSSALSGGMKQRVNLIRALAIGPKLLFCDEPFSAIDFVNRLKFNTLFKRRCVLSGTTTIFVTHNIEEAIFLGDRIAILSDRPARIVDIKNVFLSIGREDAVKCRKSPEFEKLFTDIWEDLRPRGYKL